jgi:uncharacterized small protein (DUF1192 family)
LKKSAARALGHDRSKQANPRGTLKENMARNPDEMKQLAKRMEALEAEVRALRAELKPKSRLRTAVEAMWKTSRTHDVRTVDRAIRAARRDHRSA